MSTVDEELFDPMWYDVLNDLGTRLGGAYMAKVYAATSQKDKDYWFNKVLAVSREVRAVDPGDYKAIEAKIEELSRTLRLLKQPKARSLAV